ncbi:hypothetical protein [Rhizobium bangladeshense]|nr:hypothetical protein [Rhizobium bangladeshense]MBX4894918.1 hypothetical protein [Rhizobium bangladeshense]
MTKINAREGDPTPAPEEADLPPTEAEDDPGITFDDGTTFDDGAGFQQ